MLLSSCILAKNRVIERIIQKRGSGMGHRGLQVELEWIH